MKNLLFRLFIMMLPLLSAASMPLTAEEKFNARYAYCLQGMSPLGIRDVRLGYEFFVKRYAKHYNADVELSFGSDGNKLVQQFLNGEIDYLGMTFPTFAGMLDQLTNRIQLIYISSQDEEMFESYVILTNDPKLASLAAIGGKKAAIQETNVNAAIFADSISMQYFNKRYNDGFKLNDSDSHHKAILQLFFGRADIAFVPLRSWEMAKAMNPAIGEKIRILHTSPKIFGSGVEIYRKNMPEKLTELTIRVNEDLAKTEDGRQLLRIMKVKRRESVSLDELKPYLAFYRDYYQKINTFTGHGK